jgi:aspartokinase/homoserine dehydrogenase 1
VLDIVARERAQGPVALVVSAFGDTTDALLSLAQVAARGQGEQALAMAGGLVELVRGVVKGALGGGALQGLEPGLAPVENELHRLLRAIEELEDCSPATRDRLLSIGERLSAIAVAEALRAAGIPAEAIDARAWLVTGEQHGDAQVQWEETRARIQARAAGWFEGGQVPVHTGFIGATLGGKTTTLGRNGSDYTAALLGRGLGAASVTIWTDVSGVMTADPTLVGDAYPVPNLSYREGLELAGLGLRMFHPRTMLPLLEGDIPMRIRNTLRPEDPGTRVDALGSSDPDRPTCVVSLQDMALVDLEGTPRSGGDGLASRALASLAEAGIPCWFGVQAPCGNGVALVVRGADAAREEEILAREMERELRHKSVELPRVHRPVSLVTLVAEAMGRFANVAGRFFGALGAIGVNIRASSQGATSRAISCVVDDRETENAVRAVHAAFNLAREQVNVLLLGKGTVGGQFLEQLAAEQLKLRELHDLDLRLAGVLDRRAAVLRSSGIQPSQARAALEDSSEPSDLAQALAHLARLPVPVLVDCTAADGMEAVYMDALGRGIHVVTANKKPFALPARRRAELFAAARTAHRGLRYETTVGASLPVIETLKNLVRTGDQVHRIEGSLSGTLGYLANEVSQGIRLSQAVREARRRGYTEPHPREDLSGMDVARKALILARELGLSVDLEEVDIEPFVPRELLEEGQVDAFLDGLERHDERLLAWIASLRSEGRVLRYLATITPDPHGGRPQLRVAPVGVTAEHPAARLRGSEAFVAFTTARYSEYPLVVQGSGAGGAVTAAGVLADVLALSQTLRGR